MTLTVSTHLAIQDGKWVVSILDSIYVNIPTSTFETEAQAQIASRYILSDWLEFRSKLARTTTLTPMEFRAIDLAEIVDRLCKMLIEHSADPADIWDTFDELGITQDEYQENEYVRTTSLIDPFWAILHKYAEKRRMGLF